MKSAEYLEDLDPKLADNLERALDSLRQEFEEKMTATVSQTLATAAKEAAAARRDAAPAMPAPTAAVSLDASDELRLAALDIDKAASQAETLEALSRGVLRFASRVAVFVNRGEELHGWSASGFGEADSRIKEVSLGSDDAFPMTDQVRDGAIALSADDCAPICSALGADLPSIGLVLPFVLGNQVVGTVYCDRLGEETFSISSLQLLTYIAGQTLETLPVRKREYTATLSLAGSSTETAAPDASVSAPPAPAEPDASTAADEEANPDGTAVEPAETQFEYISKEPSEADLGHPEEPEEKTEANLSASPMAEAAEPRLATPEAESLPAIPTLEEESTQPEPVTSTNHETPDSSDTAGGASALDPAEPAEPVVGLSSTQVAPPGDLQGPGWAFTSGAEPSEASSESENEEAQRLARLLVTEIKLYNEDAVESGRRDGDVYSRLQEDIDRSRQIFEDRIDPAIRGENDYFKQALVRILAGGDPALLGI